MLSMHSSAVQYTLFHKYIDRITLREASSLLTSNCKLHDKRERHVERAHDPNSSNAERKLPVLSHKNAIRDSQKVAAVYDAPTKSIMNPRTEATAQTEPSSSIDASEMSAQQHGRDSTGGTATVRNPTGSVTMTVTDAATTRHEPEPLVLTLQAHPSVRWENDVIDNEGMGRKSSKRCCIFHKQRPFDESSTDSSDQDGNDDRDKRKIARPKKSKEVPDFQRYHA